MPYVTIEEEVWVDLDDFDTDELVDELKKRKAITSTTWSGPGGNELVHEIYMAKHVRNQSYDELVDQLIYVALGKIV